jgi:hypothetical protein
MFIVTEARFLPREATQDNPPDSHQTQIPPDPPPQPPLYFLQPQLWPSQLNFNFSRKA